MSSQTRAGKRDYYAYITWYRARRTHTQHMPLTYTHDGETGRKM